MSTNDPNLYIHSTDLIYSNLFLDSTLSTTATTTNWTITGTQMPSSEVEINDKDIKIGHWSLKQEIDKINERLAILQPDPELLEKYEALRNAYDHYKTLEALLKDHSKKSK